MRCVANSHLVAAKNLSWIELEPLVSRGVLICHNRCRKGCPGIMISTNGDISWWLWYTDWLCVQKDLRLSVISVRRESPDGFSHWEHEEVEPGLHLPRAVAGIDEFHHLCISDTCKDIGHKHKYLECNCEILHELGSAESAWPFGPLDSSIRRASYT